jgi:RNA polymerase sigma-70 factor (ECF subfamily)
VESQDQHQPRPSPGAPATLGDVLYGQKHGKPLASEAEWAELVRSIASGQPASLHALYDRSHRLVFTLAVRITASRETAEEVTIDVFHDVWKRAWAYDPANGTVLGWIMNQARSRAIDRVRFEQRSKRVDPRDGQSLEPQQAADPVELLEMKQRSRAVRVALATLNGGERQAIESAFFGGFTHAEVAVRLKQPLGTIKTRIRSALLKLRQALAAGRDLS